MFKTTIINISKEVILSKYLTVNKAAYLIYLNILQSNIGIITHLSTEDKVKKLLSNNQNYPKILKVSSILKPKLEIYTQ